MGLPPVDWVAVNNKRVIVWQPTDNKYYGPPIIGKLNEFAWYITGKIKIGINQYFYGNYCSWSSVVKRRR